MNEGVHDFFIAGQGVAKACVFCTVLFASPARANARGTVEQMHSRFVVGLQGQLEHENFQSNAALGHAQKICEIEAGRLSLENTAVVLVETHCRLVNGRSELVRRRHRLSCTAQTVSSPLKLLSLVNAAKLR